MKNKNQGGRIFAFVLMEKDPDKNNT